MLSKRIVEETHRAVNILAAACFVFHVEEMIRLYWMCLCTFIAKYQDSKF